jgi:fatty acid desaturase
MALLGSLLLWHALHALRVVFRRRNRLKVAAGFAALMAMLALGTHAVAEFVFQIPAIAGTFVVLLGTIAACSERSRAPADARQAAPAAKAGPA